MLERRAEFEAFGVRILTAVGAPVPSVYRPEWLSEADFRRRLVRDERQRPRRRRGRAFKSYSGAKVEKAARQLEPWDDEPGRNKAAKYAKLSTGAVDKILMLMRAGKLAPAEEEGWLVIEGELQTTPRFIALGELLARL